MHTQHQSVSLGRARSGYLHWLTTTKDLSPHTVRAYRSDLRALGSIAGDELPIEDLTAEVLRAFFALQKANGLKASSLRRRAAGIRGFCTWLEASGHTASDPWADIRLSFRRDRSLPRAVPKQEVAVLLKHVRTAAGLQQGNVDEAIRNHHTEATMCLAIALMVATGLRVGELVSLRVADVDLPDRSVRIVGKGRRERLVFLPNTWLSGLLERYLDSRSDLHLGHDRLLYNLSGTPLSSDFVRRQLRSAAAKAGLTRHLTPHMLRHTAATQLIESGVDIRFVQRLLGHSSLSTTEIYTHISDRALRHAVVSADVLAGAMATRDN